MIKLLTGRIVSDDQICGGRPIIAGTRIEAAFIGGQILIGVPDAEIADDFGITVADVCAVREYFARKAK